MKYLFFILFFSNFILGQDANVSAIGEVDLDKESVLNLEKYYKKLNNSTKLTRLYNANFNVIYYNNNSEYKTKGKVFYNNNFYLKNIVYAEIKDIDSETQNTLKKNFNQIYRVIFSYYNISLGKQNILKDFYCIYKGDNRWLFKIKRNIKEKLDINSSNRMNFEVKLDYMGRIEKISTFVDTENDFIRDDKNIASYEFDINFANDKNRVKINGIEGNINASYKNSRIEFSMNFY